MKIKEKYKKLYEACKEIPEIQWISKEENLTFFFFCATIL